MFVYYMFNDATPGSLMQNLIIRAGYVMDDLHFAEIHFKDSERLASSSPPQPP